jgi:hypothetical protein
MDRNLQEALAGKGGDYVLPFFWMHSGNHDRLRDLVRQVYTGGVKSFCVESRPHEQFCEEAWWADMDLVLDEASRLGMKVWILDDKHFPTGYANGLVEKKYPQRRKWQLIEYHVDAAGPIKDASILLPRREEEDEIIGIVAYPRSSPDENVGFKPINLTGKLKGSFVYWDIPAGFWRIFYSCRRGLIPRPSGRSKGIKPLSATTSGVQHTSSLQGEVVDFIKTRKGARQKNYIHLIDKESVDVLIEAVYESHYQNLKKYFGDTLVGFFSDEPSFGNDFFSWGAPTFGNFDRRPGMRALALPWSDELLGRLNERFAGNTAPGFEQDPALAYLAGLWFPMDSREADIRYAYMDTVTILYRDNFCRHLGDWCRAHGVEYIGHIIEDMNSHARLGSSAGHYFRSLDGQDMSGIDIVLHQVIPGFGNMPVAVSGSAGWGDNEFYHYVLGKLGSSMAHLKPKFKNRAMCEVFGAYGWAEGAPMMKWLMDFLLVRGINRFVPHAFSPKFPDPDCPPHFGAAGRDPQFEAFTHLMEYVNKVVHLLEGAVHQAPCAVLYHAEAEWLNGDNYLKTQKPAKALYDAHLDYDIVPIDSLCEDARVVKNALVINQESYRCLVVPRSPLLPGKAVTVLKKLQTEGLPVFYVEGAPSGVIGAITVPIDGLVAKIKAAGFANIAVAENFPLLRVCQWKKDGCDYFMFFNEDVMAPVKTTVTFPRTGKYLKVKLLDGLYSAGETSGDVELTLAPYESVFFIFGASLPGANYVEKKYTAERELCLKWDIELYETGKGELDGRFKPYAQNAELHNITAADKQSEFAGFMRYVSSFRLDAVPVAAAIDLGIVGETVKLKLNGQDCGFKICPPYLFDVTGLLKQGENEIELIAANTLAQSVKDGFSFFIPLPPSGVQGPLRLFSQAC